MEVILYFLAFCMNVITIGLVLSIRRSAGCCATFDMPPDSPPPDGYEWTLFNPNEPPDLSGEFQFEAHNGGMIWITKPIKQGN